MARRRFQSGCIFLRGKKEVWVARVRRYIQQIDGSTRSAHLSIVLGPKSELPTEKLARRRLDPILADLNAQAARPGRVARVADFSDHWERTILQQLKPSTQRVMRVHLIRYIRPRLGVMQLEDVTAEAQQIFIAHLRGCVPPLSCKTIRNILGTLSSMLTAARKWGYLAPAVKLADLRLPDTGPRSEARPFTADELGAILRYSPEPYRTMFAIAALTGLRAGEILGLQSGDLDFGRRLLHVRRSAWRGRLQSLKTEQSAAVLPMPEALARILEQHILQMKPNAGGLLFANSKDKPHDAQRIVARILRPILRDKLNCAHHRRGFHAFRHAHCSMLLASGAPPTVAQKQLRHSDVRMTLAVYGHVVGNDHRRAVESVADALLPAPALENLFPVVPKSSGAAAQIQ